MYIIKSVITLLINKSDSCFADGLPILLVTHMIKDRIGVHSLLLSLLIAFTYTLPFGIYEHSYSPNVMY